MKNFPKVPEKVFARYGWDETTKSGFPIYRPNENWGARTMELLRPIWEKEEKLPFRAFFSHEEDGKTDCILIEIYNEDFISLLDEKYFDLNVYIKKENSLERVLLSSMRKLAIEYSKYLKRSFCIKEISLEESFPDKDGIYLIRAESTTTRDISKNQRIFQTRFFNHEDPKKRKFDISNQRVLSWFKM